MDKRKGVQNLHFFVQKYIANKGKLIILPKSTQIIMFNI